MFLAFLLVGLLARTISADLTLQLSYYNNSKLIGEFYTDFTPFRIQFANIQNDFKGFLHQPYPSDACDYIEPIPESASSLGHPWIAVVDNYSLCTEEMVTNVRNAGYDLVLAYSSDDARTDVDDFIANSGFGVAVFSNDYFSNTLRQYLVTNFTDLPDLPVIITIGVSQLVTPALMTCIFYVLFFCCCMSVCCGCIYCRRNRGHSLAGQFSENEGRRRTFERGLQQDRLARQELIESILRQLQELHIDMRSQMPLGREETRKLPTRKYRNGEEKIERCAICVEDFKDGDLLRVLPCDHSFHKECIDEWLINHSNVCPLCKFEVQRDGGEANPRRPPREGTPLFVDEDHSLSSSLENAEPLIIVSNSSQRNSSRGSNRQTYGSV